MVFDGRFNSVFYHEHINQFRTMKKIAFIALSTLPVLGLISCGEKEATAAPAATVTTADPIVALVETMEQLATTLEATTPENSAEQAKKIKEIAAKLPELFAKVAEKGPDAKPSPDVISRGDAAEARIDAWFEANVTNIGSYDPSFREALESIQMN